MNDDQRKQQLIAEGALYRAQALLAKERLRSSMRPGAVAIGGLQGLAATAAAAWAGSGIASGLLSRLPLLLPIALRAAKAIGARRGLRRVLAAGAATAVLGSAALAFLKRRRDASET